MQSKISGTTVPRNCVRLENSEENWHNTKLAERGSVTMETMERCSSTELSLFSPADSCVYIVVLGPIKKDPLDVSDARFNKSETRLRLLRVLGERGIERARTNFCSHVQETAAPKRYSRA